MEKNGRPMTFLEALVQPSLFFWTSKRERAVSSAGAAMRKYKVEEEAMIRRVYANGWAKKEVRATKDRRGQKVDNSTYKMRALICPMDANGVADDCSE